MKTTTKKIALALGMLTLASSCANEATSTPSQQSQKTFEVSSTAKAGTTIRVDANRGILYQFTDFYIKKAPQAVSSVGYISLPKDGYRLNYIHMYQGKVGTVFDGKAEMNLTIGELLRKEAKF